MNNMGSVNNQGKNTERLLLGLGILFILCNCLYMSTALGLDIFGNKSTGTLSVHHYKCERNRTCQRVDIEYVDDKGNDNSLYYGGILPILWDAVSPPKDGSHSWAVEVRYMRFLFPFAKVKLPFHLEYFDPQGKKTIWSMLKIWVPVIALYWWLRYGKKRQQVVATNP